MKFKMLFSVSGFADNRVELREIGTLTIKDDGSCAFAYDGIDFCDGCCIDGLSDGDKSDKLFDVIQKRVDFLREIGDYATETDLDILKNTHGVMPNDIISFVELEEYLERRRAEWIMPTFAKDDYVEFTDDGDWKYVFTWEEAQKIAEKFKGVWRLPNIYDFLFMTEEERQKLGENSTCPYFWSSSRWPGGNKNFAAALIADGDYAVQGVTKWHALSVRLIKV